MGPVRIGPLKSPRLSCAVGTRAVKRARTAPLAPPLLRPEEEDPILDDGPVEVAAEVVVAQRGSVDARAVGEQSLAFNLSLRKNSKSVP